MQTPKRLFSLVVSIVILASIATMSLASTRSSTPETSVRSEGSGAVDPSLDDDDCAAIVEACGSPAVDPADVEDDDDGDGDTPTSDVDPVREADCNAAAGIEPDDGSTDDTGDTDEPVKVTGLDNAIEHVLANCLKNPQAPGLLNALAHLTANREKHEAHAAAKAEKKAAHAAAKAQKHAGGPGHGKGHGSDGEHGNPHDGDHPNPHGSAGNGHGGSHGNGH